MPSSCPASLTRPVLPAQRHFCFLNTQAQGGSRPEVAPSRGARRGGPFLAATVIEGDGRDRCAFTVMRK